MDGWKSRFGKQIRRVFAFFVNSLKNNRKFPSVSGWQLVFGRWWWEGGGGQAPAGSTLNSGIGIGIGIEFKLGSLDSIPGLGLGSGIALNKITSTQND